jgi:methenyltetrahydromethanopterin cyclohydrolase
LAPVVIDLYGDEDTRELALEVQIVGTLAETQLAAAVDAISARYSIDAVVYGSGMEAYPSSLDYLFKRLPVRGNTPDTWRRLHDKRDFFAALDRLAIAYPETQFTPPEAPSAWLIKPYRGEGGAHIGFYDQTHVERALVSDGARGAPYEDFYWQRYQPGEAMSVLFLADTNRAEIIGFNRQWTIATATAERPFAFSGVMNDAELPDTAKHRLTDWLQTLTAEFSLAGLNSLDFIWDGRQTWALEINPRPSASLAVYDAACATGLLAGHLAACRGTMPKLSLPTVSRTAYQIVYAPSACRIPGALNWPDWAMDRPRGNSFIRAWHPICSIIARGDTPRQVLAMLRKRQQTIFNIIHAGLDNHAIYSER